MKRRSPIRRKRKTPRRSARVRDAKYLEFVRTLPCCAPTLSGSVCLLPAEAHHAGPHGLGQKCIDNETVPLCREAHAAWHDGTGQFTGWTRGQRADWARERIAETQARARAEGILPPEGET